MQIREKNRERANDSVCPGCLRPGRQEFCVKTKCDESGVMEQRPSTALLQGQQHRAFRSEWCLLPTHIMEVIVLSCPSAASQQPLAGSLAVTRTAKRGGEGESRAESSWTELSCAELRAERSRLAFISCKKKKPSRTLLLHIHHQPVSAESRVLWMFCLRELKKIEYQVLPGAQERSALYYNYIRTEVVITEISSSVLNHLSLMTLKS